MGRLRAAEGAGQRLARIHPPLSRTPAGAYACSTIECLCSAGFVHCPGRWADFLSSLHNSGDRGLRRCQNGSSIIFAAAPFTTVSEYNTHKYGFASRPSVLGVELPLPESDAEIHGHQPVHPTTMTQSRSLTSSLGSKTCLRRDDAFATRPPEDPSRPPAVPPSALGKHERSTSSRGTAPQRPAVNAPCSSTHAPSPFAASRSVALGNDPTI